HLDDVGQVVLALVVLRREPAQRRREHAAAEAVDRRVPLGDGALVGRGVALFDHAHDVAVLAADDAAVAGGVVGVRGEHRARRTGEAVLLDEPGDRGGAQQRRVTGQHEHVAVVEVVVGEDRQPDAHRVAGPPLDVLLDEVEGEVGRLLLQLLRDEVGAVTDDDHRLVDRGLPERVEHVEHHGAAAQQVQRLGPCGPHARAFAGGENDGGQRSFRHRFRSTPGGPVLPSRSGAGARTPIPGTKALCPANWTTPEGSRSAYVGGPGGRDRRQDGRYVPVMTGTDTLPRWDLRALFPSLDSRELAAAHEAVGAGVTRLIALYDARDVRGGDPVELDDATVGAFEEVLGATNELHEQLRLVAAYLNGFITTDARDDRAAALHS